MEMLDKYDIYFSVDDEYYEKYNDIIEDIFNNDNLNYDLNDPHILNILGLYYQYVMRCEHESLKYFNMAIKLKNTNAMINLAKYYTKIDVEEFEEEIEDLYLMAIELNDIDAMYDFGRYYYNNHHYFRAEKYLLMAGELNHIKSLHLLAHHNSYVLANYHKANKYLLKAVELKSTHAMIRLARFYRYAVCDYDEMKKYLLMAIELNDTDAMIFLAGFYRDENNYEEMKKYYLMVIDLYNTVKNVKNIKNFNDIHNIKNIKYNCDVSFKKLYHYYTFVIKNIDEMKELLLHHIELNNTYAMNCLSEYYEIIRNYDEMKKYLLMAVELEDTIAIDKLAKYYENERNYDEMKKYYLLNIKLNDFNYCYNSLQKLLEYFTPDYTQHYLLKPIKSRVAIEKVKQLEKGKFLGVKIFRNLTEYVFDPQRLLKLCNIYNVEMHDYMDII